MRASTVSKYLIATVSALQGFTAVLAADCDGYGLCGILNASSRDQLYAARQHVCGDTSLWQTSGSFCAAGGGRLTWPGGFPQQRCWDAFQNILDQCRPEGGGRLTTIEARGVWMEEPILYLVVREIVSKSWRAYCKLQQL